MKIIDTKTGKRLGADGKAINRQLKKDDPLMRDANKKLEVSEHSPMDPPDAYDKKSSNVNGITYADFDKVLKEMADEHKEVEQQTAKFEKALNDFHQSSYIFNQEINDRFNEFFLFFDEHILPHNRKEERFLFPVLNIKLIETGEHSPNSKKETAVDLMEDDHIKFIQLASLTFNMLGLASRLPDLKSRAMTFDLAYHNGKELVELLRLHLFREDNTVFPLAQKLLNNEEFQHIYEEMHQTLE